MQKDIMVDTATHFGQDTEDLVSDVIDVVR
jgi:hypothetical protein